MRFIKAMTIATFVISTFVVSAKGLQAEESKSPQIDREKIAISLGHFLVRHLNTPAVQHDVHKVIEGMLAELDGKKPPLSEEDLVAAISDIQTAHLETVAKENLAQAENFLAKNVNEKSVVSVNPQLQYKILHEGAGDGILAEATPMIHFSCTLLDGTVVSSTYEGGEPITLPLSDALTGIREGMIGMKQGEKRCLYIHPELGFGNASHLPPNSLLVFEVELIDALAKAPEADLQEEFSLPELEDDEG